MEHRYISGTGNAGRRGGFTLIELIMALTVLSVALTGLIAMYGISLELANQSRQKSLAAEIAESQMAMVLAAPETFRWEYDPADVAVLFPITLGTDDPKAGNTIEPPHVTLVHRIVHARNELLYRKFRWKVWGRLPSADSHFYEVTVAVHWGAQGKDRTLAFTSSLAKHRVPAPVPASTLIGEEQP